MILAAFVSNAEISGARRGGRLYNKIAGHGNRIRRFESFSVMASARLWLRLSYLS